jgi:hypothetical protein
MAMQGRGEKGRKEERAMAHANEFGTGVAERGTESKAT